MNSERVAKSHVERPDVRLTAGVALLSRARMQTPTGTKRLTTREVELLAYLHERAGEVVSKDQLLSDVWGYRPGVVTRAVENTVMRLRAKVEVNPKEPDHIVTVVGTGYRFVTGEARSPLSARRRSAVPTNVALSATRFIGRDRELAQLGLALESHSLVMILGSGGAGKTRLAREFALYRSEPFSAGAFFVDLTSARMDGDVLAAIREALGLATVVDQTLDAEVGRIARVLASRGDLLLILDNLEQLVGQLSQITSTLLEVAPALRILGTSRAAHSFDGEFVLPLPELSVREGVALFVDRASLVRSDFQPDEEEMGIVEEVCTALEGIPLAIELAAARSLVLSPAGIRGRLAEPLKILRTSRPSADARHKTLRRTFDWSWELLSVAQQRAFATCSVFRGGFLLDDAEVVAVEGSVVDDLEALCAHSLLKSTRGKTGLRFTLLETARTYAGERLEEFPDLESACPLRHARRYLEVAEEHLERMRGPDYVLRIDAIQRELPNLQAAFELLATDHPDEACRIALVMDWALGVRGPWMRRVSLNRAALAIVAEPILRARLLVNRYFLRKAQSLVELAGDDLREAIDLARRANDKQVEASALARLASWCLFSGNPQSGNAAVQDALVAARACDDWDLEASCYQTRANIARRTGNYDLALDSHVRAAEIRRAHGDAPPLANNLMGIGTVKMQQGRFEEANYFMNQAREIFVRVGDLVGESRVLGNLGALAMFTEPAAVTLERLMVAERAFCNIASTRDQAIALCNIAETQLNLGQPLEARASADRARRLVAGMQTLLLHAVLQMTHGRISHFLGDHASGRERYVTSRALMLESKAPSKHLRWLECQHACLEADDDLPERAREILEAGTPHPDKRGVALERITHLHIDLAVARRARHVGEIERARRLWRAAEIELDREIPAGMEQAHLLLRRALDAVIGKDL